MPTMARNERTLQEVMRSILSEQPERTATFKLLSQENRRRRWYRRPDGEYPNPHHVRARAKRHPELFDRIGDGMVRLKA